VAHKEVAVAESRRYESFKLADELRQSSDDLTRMARTYVVTGNPAYREYFQEILAIRSGASPRPVNYDRPYWDLLRLDRKRLSPEGKSQPLLERMREMEFTDEEMVMLKVAQQKSDKLVELEDQAMFAMVGKFDDGSGNYTVEKPPDPELARQLLHGEAYHQAKYEIMTEINAFFDRVETRTLRQMRTAQAKEEHYRSFAWPLGLLAIMVSVLSYFFLGRNAVSPIQELSNHAAALSEGKYGQHADVRGFHEVGELSQTFNQMTEAIVRDIEQRNDILEELRVAKDAALGAYGVIKSDLAAAAEVQQSLLPQKMPNCPGVRFTYAYAPCDDLAGDTLNVFLLDDRHIGLYLLDVSGHGVQAALLASTLSHVLTPIKTADSVLWSGKGHNEIASPATVAGLLNESFPLNPDTSQYFTIHYGVLDTRSLEYTFISAGHPGPMHICKEGKQEILHVRGAGIGILADPVFEQKKVKLAAGDRMIFFSDGVLESCNESDVQFQDEELASCLRETTDKTMEQCMDHLIRSVAQWSHGKQEDDISALVMQIDST
jgi:serine phosphatase RsbU (regulator of sigma subunit)